MTEQGSGGASATPVWEHLEGLSDQELAALVQSAIFVLEQGGDGDGPSPATMPPGPIVRSLQGLLDERDVDPGAAERVVRDPEVSRPVALLILGEIARQPALAAEIEAVWRERGGMMVVGAGAIAAAALLLLVLKIKRVRVGRKKGVDVEFEEVSEGALGSVLRFLGG